LLLDTEPRLSRLLKRKIDRHLSTICLKCLAKDPKRRYSSALALAEDLERWLTHEPIQARHTGVFARGGKWVRRNPTSALLVASLVGLAAAAGWIVWKSELIRQPPTTGIAVLPFENLSEQKEDGAFAVQSEIAQKVADHLHAKLSATEKASVEERPTDDLVAYDFYVRAVSLITIALVPSQAGGVNFSDAADLLTKAVARDPNFFLAYCQLAFVHDLIYNGDTWFHHRETDHTPARLALAKSAIDSVFRLRPDSGEAHLALAWHLYWGYSDYDGVRAELALVQQGLPNDARAFELAGLID